MLRTNLSTRPFYNERAVALVLGLLAVIVGAFTLFNVSRLVVLSSRHADLRSRADQAEHRSAELRQQAARTRATLDATNVEEVAQAAREANVLIDRRTFSWTELFNRLEATLPPDVRVTAIRPSLEEGRFLVTMNVVARSVDDVDAFIEALEKSGGFADVLAREERTNEEGQIEGTLDGVYLAGHGAAMPDVGRPR